MNFSFQAGGFAGKTSQPIISFDSVPDAIATLVFSRSRWSSQSVFPVQQFIPSHNNIPRYSTKRGTSHWCWEPWASQDVKHRASSTVTQSTLLCPTWWTAWWFWRLETFRRSMEATIDQSQGLFTNICDVLPWIPKSQNVFMYKMAVTIFKKSKNRWKYEMLPIDSMVVLTIHTNNEMLMIQPKYGFVVCDVFI